MICSGASEQEGLISAHQAFLSLSEAFLNLSVALVSAGTDPGHTLVPLIVVQNRALCPLLNLT